MPGVRPDQAALTHRDDLLAPAGERAHDRGAAADVGVRPHHHAGRDAALDHRGAQRAGVEVAEALVHDRGSGGQVGAEADTGGVGDADPAGCHVVEHRGELVEAVDVGMTTGGQQAQPGGVEVLGVAGALAGPGDVAEQSEDPVEVQAVGSGQPGRQQVEAQVDVAGVHGGIVEVGNPHDDATTPDPPGLVVAHQRRPRVGRRPIGQPGAGRRRPASSTTVVPGGHAWPGGRSAPPERRRSARRGAARPRSPRTWPRRRRTRPGPGRCPWPGQYPAPGPSPMPPAAVFAPVHDRPVP